LGKFLDDTITLERILPLLERGITDSHNPFHTATLATVAPNGEPEARTVVFRRLLQEPLALICHIDIRSPKAEEIRLDQRVSWLFYNPAEKLQLRFRTRAFLHTDDALAEEQWQSSALFSRRSYCGAAPTTAVDEPSSGLPANLEDRRPTEAETSELGRKNFGVVRSVIGELDVYELNAHGHRRRLFVFAETGEIETEWLTP
jgi:pyridoxine/pyridoxamine 5'-phosphate oxidase